MKVHCPSCQQPIAAADVALDQGWAKCQGCNEVFPLAGVLAGYAGLAPSIPSRPFDAWAVVHREPDRLTVHLPAKGMNKAAVGGLAFAGFWLAFIAFWTASALGMGFNKKGGAGFAAFSIPFWMIGVGMLGGVVWMAKRSRSVMVDAAQFTSELRCLFWRRMRSVERDQVQCAREGVSAWSPRQEGHPPIPAVDIVLRQRRFQLPCGSTAERDWLIAEINQFLEAVPYDPAARRWSGEPLP
jgi:hypothetical protein